MLEENFKDQLIDVHTHMDERMKQESNIQMVCNVSSKEDYVKFIEWNKVRTKDTYSVGVHPWDADKITIEEILPYINKAELIGEIGLDNVWCSVDLKIQEKIFKEQLEIAKRINKSVVLHTKGMEKRIAEIIKDYPNIYIVHWFADIESLDLYKSLDCYFSIGPAVLVDKEIEEIVKNIDLKRVLFETDGLPAIEWLFDKKISNDEFYRIIEDTYKKLADIYGIPSDQLVRQIYDNTIHVLKRT